MIGYIDDYAEGALAIVRGVFEIHTFVRFSCNKSTFDGRERPQGVFK
jgi:hypothetical protein